MPPSSEERARAWIRDASRSLRTANRIFAIEEYDACCFYAHLSAEKSLKALIYFSTDTDRDISDHSIARLYGALIEPYPEIKSVFEDVQIFADYDSYLRYLDNRDLSSPDFRYRHENAEEALHAAENILTAAKNIVNSATEIINSRLRNI